ncbi:MAG TPA: macrolide ABC transporter ATP-binding protein, partial [Phycisphaerales bacterium]|nr:macrolide ABC transporter ATP-binding protein [Phycisphaerales bacterium]
PSGSGKSTLLAILGLLDKSDRGSYRLNGIDVVKLNDSEYANLRSRYLGFIFQSFNLLPRFNVLENTKLPLLYAVATHEDSNRVLDILKKVGLSDRLKHKPNEISGGQQQRVAIARALANNPLIIFADEPTGNLDSHTGDQIMQLLTNLNREGVTIIMVTHEPDIAAYAHFRLHMKDGKVERIDQN